MWEMGQNINSEHVLKNNCLVAQEEKKKKKESQSEPNSTKKTHVTIIYFDGLVSRPCNS